MSMEERLRIWKERKKNAKNNSTDIVTKSPNKSSAGDIKTARKRNHKYINSSIQHTTDKSITRNVSNKIIDTQKKTKKENDDPNYTGEIPARDCEKSVSTTCNDVVREPPVSDCKLTRQSQSSVCQQYNASPEILAYVEEVMARNEELTKQLSSAVYERKQALKIAKISIAENNALKFEIEVITQTVDELEMQLSQCRMDAFESESDNEKMQQLEATIRFLKRQNEEYKLKADSMVSEISEQLSSFQDVAMKRIQSLENDLMLERHKSEAQESMISKLQDAQRDTAVIKKAKTRNRRNTRRQSCFMSMGSLDSLGSDETLEDDDNDEEREFDLELGGDEDI